jgi:hypothetical protein
MFRKGLLPDNCVVVTFNRHKYRLPIYGNITIK